MAKWIEIRKEEPKSKLYLLTSLAETRSYDVVRSMVVRATTEEEARKAASLKSMDETATTWLLPKLSHCEVIPIEGETQVLCIDSING